MDKQNPFSKGKNNNSKEKQFMKLKRKTGPDEAADEIGENTAAEGDQTRSAKEDELGENS